MSVELRGLRALGPRTFAFAALLGATPACSSQDVPLVRLDLPVTAEDHAVIVAVERPNEALELTALAIAADGTIPALAERIGTDEAVVVSALLYHAPLPVLGVGSGAITVLSADQRGRRLPTPDAVWKSTLAPGGTASAWSRASLDAVVADVEVAPLDTCATFTETSWVLTTTHAAAFVAPASERGVLIGDDADDDHIKLFYVERDGFVRVTPPPSIHGVGQIPIYGAFRDGEGGLWLGSEIGGVWRGGLQPDACDAHDHPCRAVEAAEAGILTFSGDIFAISGPPEGPPNSLFALTEEGALERWDGEHWYRAYDFRGLPEDSYRSGVAWIAPGEGVAASEREPTVVRLKDDTFTVEALPQPSDPPVGVSAIAHVPRFGDVAGDLSGHLYVDYGYGWQRLEAESDTLIRSIVPYRSGFAWSDEEGTIGQWVPGAGACPKIARTSGNTDQLHLLAVVGEDLVATGTRQAEGTVRVRWLARDAR